MTEKKKKTKQNKKTDRIQTHNCQFECNKSEVNCFTILYTKEWFRTLLLIVAINIDLATFIILKS